MKPTEFQINTILLKESIAQKEARGISIETALILTYFGVMEAAERLGGDIVEQADRDMRFMIESLYPDLSEQVFLEIAEDE